MILDCWNILGISPSTDKKVIKKAYSALLKQHRPDTDPAGYQQLREAFDLAIERCRIAASAKEVPRDNIAPSSVSNCQETKIQKNAESYFEASADTNLQQTDQQQDEEPSSKLDKPQPILETDSDKKSGFLDTEDLPNPTDSEQAPYDEALAAANSIFNSENEDAGLAIFTKIVHENRLLNLKTKAYFEHMLLHFFVQQGNESIPYQLIRAAADEFHWFEEQHVDPEKRQSVLYLENRLNCFKAYTNTLVTTSQSGAAGDKAAAKLMLGSFRPKYFHLIRFIGNQNRTMRKYTSYFSSAVHQGMCPELDTATFHWWDTRLSQSLYSAWHIIVATILFIFLSSFLGSSAPSIHTEFIPYAISLTIISLSLVIWGADALRIKYINNILYTWNRIKHLRTTETILSGVFILSIIIWRENGSVEHIDWLIALALTVSAILFGVFGTMMILGSASVYWICYLVIDVLEKNPKAASFSLIMGFISYKILLLILSKIPNKAHKKIVNNSLLLYICAGVISFTTSIIYLKIII